MNDSSDATTDIDPAPLLPAERLWTPWRMQYVGGGTREDGCVFCNRLAESDDVASLILHRGAHSFAIMNLFPYNTGHAMILPNAHLASPEELTDETAVEMTRFLPRLLAAMRVALGPGGFNVGMNLGAVAGAGIAAHLHQHVVPRWPGDANFMPIIANTKAMPELIPVSYAKIRAELNRSPEPVTIVAFDHHRESIFVSSGDDSRLSLPAFDPIDGVAQWTNGQTTLRAMGIDAYLIGWAGGKSALDVDASALSYLGVRQAESTLVPLSLDSLDGLREEDRGHVEQALANLHD